MILGLIEDVLVLAHLLCLGNMEMMCMNGEIAFITPSVSYGGAEKILIFVANSCASVFDKVTIISLKKDKPALNIDHRVNVVYLNNKSRSKYKSKLLNKVVEKIKIVQMLRKSLKEINPNLLVAFGVNYIFISFLASIGLNIKIIGSERRSPQHLSFIWKSISRLIYPRCDGIVFQLEEAKSFYNTKTNYKSIVIPNPYLSPKNYVPYDTDKRHKTITAAAARLEHAKGFDILIKAFKLVKEKHPDFELVIYGCGNPDSEYGELIKSLKIEDSIKFPGLVADVVDAVYRSSVFVLPSRFEGIPNILLEVMGAGVPTVSCDCSPGGPRLLTDNGRRGLLVGVNDYKELSNAICKIIEDKALSTKLSNCGLEVRNEFRKEKISKMWIDFFMKVLSGNSNQLLNK